MSVPDVSLILPVYNETTRLVEGMRDVVTYFSFSRLSWSYEILLVDDGSSISASEVIDYLVSTSILKQVRLMIRTGRFRIIRTEQNFGKGHAVAVGVAASSGRSILFADIDGSVPWKMLPALVAELKKADIVVGSRRVDQSVIAVHQPFLRESAGRVYTYLSTSLFGIPVHDVTCGFKGFRREAAISLFSQSRIYRWAFDTEILFLASQKGYTMHELPVAWENRPGSRVKAGDMVYSARDLIRIAWSGVSGGYDMKKNSKLFPSLKSGGDRQNSKKRILSPQPSALNSIICDSCGGSSFTFLFNHHHDWKVQRCDQCGLTQVIPRPIPQEVANLYHEDLAHFDPYADQLSVHQAYFHDKVELIRHLLADGKRRLHLLDVGCALGVLLKEAAKQEVTAEGIDLSEDAVTYCKKEGLTATHGTLAQFQKKDNKKRYEVITGFEVIEHEYSPRSMVTAMHEMLVPGGAALVTTPNHGSMWRRVMGTYWPGYQHTEHLFFFDPKSLERLFYSAGFREVTVSHDAARPFPLSFLFIRAADYFPPLAPILKGIGNVIKPFGLVNPINPWDDLLVVAKK